MDNGAHFYKCDFQVHTPRDAQWKGAGAITDDERGQYAVEFVAACRERGLGAVAITDHHDLAFFRFIRHAAAAETDDHGRPLPENERLVVFPGMELTLAVPCQALLLLDADFPVDLLSQVVHGLSVTPSPDSDAKTAHTTRLEHIKTLEDLYDELNKKEFLRRRFVVLPHVGESGSSSMLRKGMAAQYKSMPCVGGFVDGKVAQHGKGNSDIVNGISKEWGNKAIAVFQTSDNRSRDFSKLGTSVTWVKWARPTAEAIRQACLARFSRVAHSEPRIPTVRITRVEVSNSRFLGPVALEFNPQYNAVIGSRGTGKSTILEYIRWALCDQPPVADEDELADFQRRRKSLIDGTLLPLDAAVDVSFLLNDVPHIVRRRATGELTLKIGSAGFQACTEQNVRELLPIRAYSQKQLSAVGARLDELRRFVHAPVQGQLDAIAERIAGLAADLRGAFDRLTRYQTLQAEIAAHGIERESIVEQIETLRKSLKGLSPGDRDIIARQAAYEAEQRIVQALERDADSAKNAIAAASDGLKSIPRPLDRKASPENIDVLKGAHDSLSAWTTEARASLSELGAAFEDPVATKSLGDFFGKLGDWRARRDAHREKYEAAKARAAAHEETLRKIQTLEERLTEIEGIAGTKGQQIAKLGDPSTDFASARATWRTAHRERADLLEQQCANLTSVSKSKLRATLLRAADLDPLADRVRALLKGTKIRGDRIENLMNQISTAGDPLDAWHAILDELHAIAGVRVEDESVVALPAVPRLDLAGFTQKEKIALARQLQPSTWIDLLLFDLEDLPVFEYQVRQNDYLPFEKASPGQQATALLSILLLQDGPPLLIDQPEDDLNMKIINDIVATLWQAKSHRQVVFASHNANLVVNGDAELIICCDYRTSATESGGHIKLTGAIDVPAINTEIAEVMEGGVDAFKLRHDKYGF
jgi:type III restriction enzyme